MAFDSREGQSSGVCRHCSTLRSPHDGSCACNWEAIANGAGPAEDVGQTAPAGFENTPIEQNREHSHPTHCKDCKEIIDGGDKLDGIWGTDRLDSTHNSETGNHPAHKGRCASCAHTKLAQYNPASLLGKFNPTKGCEGCKDLARKMTSAVRPGTRAGEESAEPNQNDDDEEGSELLAKQLMEGKPNSEPRMTRVTDDNVRVARALSRKVAKEKERKSEFATEDPYTDTTSEHPHGGNPDVYGCDHCDKLTSIEFDHRYGDHDNDMNPDCRHCQNKQIPGTLV
jgi:hypothetical protein